jgi:5'-deoxynucleotidase YfbR-like HD superfamily hydrolase/competence protein ComGF
MLRKALLTRMYDAAYMRRWNDKICPVELRELDKQAHKMVIAYVIGKLQEDKSSRIEWKEIIRGGIFEFLQRLVLTDIKPQIFHKIESDPVRYKKLNEWVFEQLEPVLTPLGSSFLNGFKGYFTSTDEVLERRILHAAHFQATRWEFNIIERANPGGYEISQIKRNIDSLQEKYYDLEGVRTLALSGGLRSFVDLCGELRFQLRWSHIGHMEPRTSVLGHMFIVAMLSFMLSEDMDACQKRCYNNFFTGLFHDLPEVLTRDIIYPVKKSIKGLDALIKKYEAEQMKEEVYPLLPDQWRPEIQLFTEHEFSNVVLEDGKIREKKLEDLENYNEDRFSPRDGGLILAVDQLSAFLEASLAIQNGIIHPDLKEAVTKLRSPYIGKKIGNTNFGTIFADF